MPNYLPKGNKRKRFKRHGFLKRMSNKKGSQVVNRRRSKGRKRLAQ
ncbi:MAG: 50S ribosomal protein L34 [Candidatus Peregrinibacteria bacterium]